MMNKKMIRLLALVLCLAALGVTVLSGCGQKAEPTETVALLHDGDVLGEGSTEFLFRVKNLEGEELTVTIHTNQETVGKALQELKLVAGEDGDFGLYIKTVNGQNLDFDKDGHYWAFYEGDTYASQSADQTKIVPGSVYTLAAE